MGKGGRQEDFPVPQHGLEHPGITQPPSAPHQHLPAHRSTPHPARMRQGIPKPQIQLGGCQERGSAPSTPNPAWGRLCPPGAAESRR